MDLLNKIEELEKKCLEKEEYIKYLENLSEINNNVMALANQERLESEKIIEAHEKIHGLSHLMGNKKSEENSALEAQDRNDIKVVLPFKSLLENGIQLYDILNDFGRELVAKRIVLFMRVYNKYLSKLMLGIDLGEMKNPSFELSLDLIKETIKTKKGVSIKDKKTMVDNQEQCITMMTIPILYNKDLLGVIYLDNHGF